MSQNPLFYVNVLARDMIALADFYQKLFDLEEITASRSEYFIGFETGGCCVGISSTGAYDLLSLTKPDTQTDTILMSFGAPNPEDVDTRCDLAVKLGGAIVKSPFETYYGWYQAVVRDPEGNPFRINYMP
jgi:predicted enzyme related to lactoylglutathione lyase